MQEIWLTRSAEESNHSGALIYRSRRAVPPWLREMSTILSVASWS